jgi:hypothetical protein
VLKTAPGPGSDHVLGPASTTRREGRTKPRALRPISSAVNSAQGAISIVCLGPIIWLVTFDSSQHAAGRRASRLLHRPLYARFPALREQPNLSPTAAGPSAVSAEASKLEAFWRWTKLEANCGAGSRIGQASFALRSAVHEAQVDAGCREAKNLLSSALGFGASPGGRGW